MFVKKCEQCGRVFKAESDRAKYCATRCRTAATRARKRLADVPSVVDGARMVALPPMAAEKQAAGGGMVEVTAAALEAAGRVNTPMGRATLLIAQILDSGIQDTGSSIAALIRQYDASLTKALDGAQVAETPLERQKRQRQLRTA